MTDWKALCEELLGLWDAQPLPPYQSSWAGVVSRARAVIAADRARWSHQPAPPAAGEVAELVAWLRDHACVLNSSAERKARRICDLLERQAAPVPLLPDEAQVIEPATALPLPNGKVES